MRSQLLSIPQFHIFDLRGKIVQNIKFSPVSQNSDYNLKIRPYSSTQVQEYAWFPKQSYRYQVIEISYKSRQLTYLEKRNFQQKLVYKLWDLHWIYGIKMSLGVPLDPDFESWLALHAKQGNVKLIFLTVSLEKHDSLQANPNIDILYIVGKYFLLRLRMWDGYLKVRLRLARINWQSFTILHRKAWWRSKHFHRGRRVPLW